jgi:hypothetical protein
LKKSSPEKDQMDLISKIYNVFNRYIASPLLLGIHPELTPCIRIALFNKENNLVLDSTFFWDDILFLAVKIT